MKGILTFKFKHKKPLLVELLENKDKEIEILKENNENMQIEMASCWEKIDKAIEYIKDNIIDFDFVNSEYPKRKNTIDIEINEEIIKDLVDILKGVDKE